MTSALYTGYACLECFRVFLGRRGVLGGVILILRTASMEFVYVLSSWCCNVSQPITQTTAQGHGTNAYEMFGEPMYRYSVHQHLHAVHVLYYSY